MSNLDIQNLKRNPSVSRQKSFHKMAAKMLTGKEIVTPSVEKSLREAGVFFGKKKLSRPEYGKSLKAFTKHLKEKGVKTSYFGKKVMASVRTGKSDALVKGGLAYKVFEQNIKQQISAGKPTGNFSDLDSGTQRKLVSKFLERGRISKEDRKLLSDEGFQELKKRTEQIKSINVFYRKTEMEKENKKKMDEAQSSVSKLGKENEDKNGQKTAPSPSSRNQSSVPLQGGLGAGTGIESPESIPKIETIAPVVKELSEEKPTESPKVKEETPSTEDENKDLPDMDIG